MRLLGNELSLVAGKEKPVPGVTGLLVRRLSVSLEATRRSTRSLLRHALVSLSKVRSCPSCHKWVGEGMDTCAGGHPVH
ncbi:hypothetical protein [Streptomyces sp. NPDC001811]